MIMQPEGIHNLSRRSRQLRCPGQTLLMRHALMAPSMTPDDVLLQGDVNAITGRMVSIKEAMSSP